MTSASYGIRFHLNSIMGNIGGLKGVEALAICSYLGVCRGIQIASILTDYGHRSSPLEAKIFQFLVR